MAMNDRIVVDSGDVAYGQLAPSQALRENFTPGKATGKPLDMNWPTDFRIPTGTPAFDGESAGPVRMARRRVVKLGRGSVCDQTVLDPTVLGVRVETRAESGIDGTDTVTDTAQPPNLANRERRTGFDNIAGA
jgi:hypothetical protein